VNRRPKRGGPRWGLSILLHLAIVGAIFGIWYWSAHRPRPVQSMGIEARVVSGEELAPASAPPPPEPAPEPQPQPAPPAEAAPEPAPEPAVEPGPTAEELAAQQAEAARVADERRLAQEREAADRKAAAEKAERERKAREKAARDKAAKEKAERDRLAREKAAKAAEQKARQQREDELSAQLAAEERLAAARASGLQNQYIAQITARIERAWIRPPSATVGLDCEVRVTQVPGGVVTGVVVGRCNGDEAVRQSIEAAVYRASPLPEPPDPSLFDRNLRFNFKPTK
jgi:colicin import membrane protein